MIRRMMLPVFAALLGLVIGMTPADAAFTFGPWTVTSPPALADTVPNPPALPGRHVIGSACLSENECVMIGQDTTAAGRTAFFITITGSTSITTRAPLPSDAVLDSRRPVVLSDISCAAGVGCVATGSYPIANGHRRVLVETRGVTGAWSAATIAGVPDGGIAAMPLAVDVDLDSVACNPQWCVAGGFASEPFPQIPLLYVRDNTIANAPWVKAVGVGPVAAAQRNIDHVACPPQGRCAAVGFAEINGADHAAMLVQHPDGWHAALTSDPPNTDRQFLYGLSCWADGNCAALGLDYTDPARQGVVAATLSNGQLQPTEQVALPADVRSPHVTTTGLSCAPPGVCVGTGGLDYGVGGPPANGLLIERTATGGWTTSRALHPPTTDPSAWSNLLDVTCVRPSLCVAVGSWGTNVTGRHALVEVRMSGGWEPRGLDLPALPPRPDNSYLDVVSCAGVRCAAAGVADFTPYAPAVPMIARSSALTT